MIAAVLRALLGATVLACPVWCFAGAAGAQVPSADAACCRHCSEAPAGSSSHRSPADGSDESSCQCFCGGAVLEKPSSAVPVSDGSPVAELPEVRIDVNGSRVQPLSSGATDPGACARPGRAVCLRTMRFLC